MAGGGGFLVPAGAFSVVRGVYRGVYCGETFHRGFSRAVSERPAVQGYFCCRGCGGIADGCFALLLPGHALTRLGSLKDSMAGFNQFYVAGNYGLPFGDSLYGVAKIVIYKTHWFLKDLSDAGLASFRAKFMAYYFRFAVLAFSAVSVLLIGFRMKLWQKVALLVCAMNLLPFICADYRLIHLFIPLLLFLREEKPLRGERFYCAVFGLLLIPKAFAYFSFDPVFEMKPFEGFPGAGAESAALRCGVCGGEPAPDDCAFRRDSVSVLRDAHASETAIWFFSLLKRVRPGARTPAAMPTGGCNV